MLDWTLLAGRLGLLAHVERVNVCKDNGKKSARLESIMHLWATIVFVLGGNKWSLTGLARRHAVTQSN